MIIPKSFSVNNFCQFAEKTYTYEPGVTTVTAMNGAGKSNFFDTGQCFAWTGKLHKEKTKKNVLKWGQKTGSASCEFQVGSSIFQLHWAIPGSASCLIERDINTGKELKNLSSNQDITDTLESILQMPLRMFRDLSWVSQGQFMSVIKDTQTRINYFQRIADVSRFSEMRQHVLDLRQAVVTYPDNTAEITRLKADIKYYEEQIQTFEKSVNSTHSDMKNIMERYNKVRGMEYKTSKEFYQQKLLELQSSTVLQQEKPIVPEPPEAPELGEIRHTLVNLLSQEQNLKNQIKYLEDQINHHNFTMTDLRARQQGGERTGDQTVSQNQNFYDAETVELQLGLKKAAEISEKQHTCVLCSQTLPEDFSSREFIQSAEQARKQKEAYDAHLKSLAQEEATIEHLKKQYLEAAKNLEEVENQLEKNPYTLEFIDAEISKYHEAQQQFTQKLQELQNWNQATSQIQQQISIVNKDLKEAPPQQMIDEAKELSAQFATINSKHQSIVTELEKSKVALTNTEAALKEKKEQEEKRQKMNTLTQVISVASDVLHSKNLPRAVMQPILDPYNAYLSHYLSQCNVDYTCRMTSDFKFEFNHGEGWYDAVVHMSGGQKVNLALCNYLAVMKVIKPTCPILTLDEPTDSLDAERKEGFVNALRKIEAADNGMYIQVITHDDAVKNAADKRIEL